jgi:hypothetical protein
VVEETSTFFQNRFREAFAFVVSVTAGFWAAVAYRQTPHLVLRAAKLVKVKNIKLKRDVTSASWFLHVLNLHQTHDPPNTRPTEGNILLFL